MSDGAVVREILIEKVNPLIIPVAKDDDDALGRWDIARFRWPRTTVGRWSARGEDSLGVSLYI